MFSQGALFGLSATKEVLLKLLRAVVSTFFLPFQNTHSTSTSTFEDLLLLFGITVCVSMSGRESGASRKHPPVDSNPFAANKRHGGPRSRRHGKNPKFPTNWQCFSLYAKFFNIDHTGYVRVTLVYGLPLSRYYFGFYSLTLYHVVAHDPARRCSYVLSIFTNVVCCLSLYHVVAHDPDSCVYNRRKNCCELLTCTILDCFRTN